jgi:hypothetical protein
MLWLVAGGLALGALAIAATSYVMRLDQEAEEVGSVPISRSMAALLWTAMAEPRQP